MVFFPTSKNLLSEIGHVHFMWRYRTPSDSLVAPMRPYSKEIQNCRSDMHFKWLCTPVGLRKGSSNSTAKGLIGRLQEQNDLFLVGSEDD